MTADVCDKEDVITRKGEITHHLEKFNSETHECEAFLKANSGLKLKELQKVTILAIII